MSGVLPRIIITAEEAQDELKQLCYVIKARPLCPLCPMCLLCTL